MFSLLAVTLTAALFLWGGARISASDFGSWHDLVHVFTFALLTLLYARALPRVRWYWISVCMIALGGAHELYQYATSGDRFEYGDFLLNTVGAGLGIASLALASQSRR